VGGSSASEENHHDGHGRLVLSVRDGAGFARLDTVIVALDQGRLPLACRQACSAHACTPADASPATASEGAPRQLRRRGPISWHLASSNPSSISTRYQLDSGSSRISVRRRHREGCCRNKQTSKCRVPNGASRSCLVSKCVEHAEELQRSRCLISVKPSMNRC
jgi:hypothetical protein